MKKKEKRPIERIEAAADVGLTSEQVAQRVDSGYTNYVKKVIGKSYLAIFASNVFTFFNLLGILIFILMLFCGSVENMMFFVIIFCNTAIGIFQEIRSKRAVEKLSIVQEPTLDVVRDGKIVEIASKDVVLDDVVAYSSGRQICADGIVIEGEVEVNESLLTGESVSVKKQVGDLLYSGSYVVSGNCRARTDKVGEDCYVQQLSAQVKKFKKPNSELMKGITSIIKFISWIVFPLGLATFLTSGSLVDGHFAEIMQVQQALKKAAGSMIGMVPSGMVLLTSVALAVSVLRLVKKHVLVRELYCIEMLSRVDTLCLDKTGTITDGSMTVEEVVILDEEKAANLDKMIASVLAATKDSNMTAVALKNKFTSEQSYDSSVCVPFSSERKFSAATLSGIGTVAIGAAEFMVKDLSQQFNETSDRLLRRGLRVLTVCRSDSPIEDGTVQNLVPVAIVALQDTVRSDAAEIIGWFKQNDVAVKVISGDNPLSVSVIAQKVGVENADKYISLDNLSDEQVVDAANKYTVFGRVKPEQKALLVTAMKKEGHTVAMTGDGVNDILAMKESDCAISVGCGSDAAKSVAQLVLTDNQFGSMPKVVAEGRRVVNNIQNSSSLFLMKTSMTVFTTILLLFLPYEYPFQPQHLYAMEFFVIGICSFLLALKPNTNRIKGKFVPNTLKSTLPSGIAMFLSVAMTYAFVKPLGISNDPQQITTVAMFSMTATGVLALLILLYPYDKVNYLIGALSVVGTVGCYVVFPWALGLLNSILGRPAPDPMFVSIDSNAILFIAINALVMAAIIICGKIVMRQIAKKKEKAQ